jgi:hypothetical protein
MLWQGCFKRATKLAFIFYKHFKILPPRNRLSPSVEQSESTLFGLPSRSPFAVFLHRLFYPFAHSLKGMRIALIYWRLPEKFLKSDPFQAKDKIHDGILMLA